MNASTRKIETELFLALDCVDYDGRTDRPLLDSDNDGWVCDESDDCRWCDEQGNWHDGNDQFDDDDLANLCNSEDCVDCDDDVPF
jgi:hypothetical protein